MSTTLGEILRKVSVDIFSDLKTKLGEMKSQDAELRTAVMKLFLARSKAKLIQCYSIAKWLSNRGVVNNLQGVSNFQNQIGNIEDVLNQQLDEVYFSHASIYSMRSRQIEVSSSAEILSSSEYKSLPLSVFSCGIPETPILREASETLADLDVCIRIKLLSDTSFPQHYSQNVTVQNGTLTVSVPKYFSVHLTLRQLNIDASWSVLGFHVLSVDHTQSTPTLGVMSFEALAKKVSDIIAEICLSTPSLDDKLADTERSTLTRILGLCRHTSLAAGLRLLHRQASELSGSTWRGTLQVAFDEVQQQTGTSSCLNLHLWKSQFSREHQVTVCVTLHSARSAQHSTQPLTIDLLAKASVSSPGGHQSSFGGTELDAEVYLQDGARLTDLLADALSLLVVEKVKHLALRFRRALDEMPDVISKLYEVDVRRSSLVVSRVALDNAPGLVVEVDVRTGKYLLSSSGAALGADVLSDYQRDMELLISEINNVQAEQLFARYVTRDRLSVAVSASEDGSIRTLETVLRRLELHVWDSRATALGLRSTNITCSALARTSTLPPSGCLAYQLDEWLLANCERLRTEHDHALALNACKRIPLKVESTDTTKVVGKKRRIDQSASASKTVTDHAEDFLVRLFLLLVVADDLSLSVHAVLRVPTLPVSSLSGKFSKPSSLTEEATCFLGGGMRCEGADAEDVAALVLNGAVDNALAWARGRLVHSSVNFESDNIVAEIEEDSIPLLLLLRDERPVAAVMASSQQMCVSFPDSFSGLESLFIGDRVSQLVGSVACLSGRASPTQLMGLFLSGGGESRDSPQDQLRVSLFDGLTPQALVETVCLRPVDGIVEGAVDVLQSVFEAFLRHVLQKVLALNPVALDRAGLLRVVFDIQPLVQLLSHALRLRIVASDDNSQELRVFLRPVSHSVCASHVTATLAVHRMEGSSELDVVVGYVELSAPLGISESVRVRDLSITTSLVGEETTVAAQTQLNSIVFSMCK